MHLLVGDARHRERELIDELDPAVVVTCDRSGADLDGDAATVVIMGGAQQRHVEARR